MSFALTGIFIAALMLPPQAQPARSAPATGSLSGQVIDAKSGNPMAGVRVLLVPAGRMMMAPGGPNGPLQVVTDRNGQFTFEALRPGRYRLDVQKTGFVPAGDPSEPRTVDVVAGNPTARVELALKRGGVITGHVLAPNGEPITEAMVTAVRAGGSPSDRPMPMYGMAQVAQTNDVGEFRIAGLVEGAYLVIAAPRPQFPLGQPVKPTSSGTAMAPTYYPSTTNKDGAESVSVAAAQIVNGIEITMVSTPAFSVSGVVVDDAGTAVVGAMVSLLTDPRAGGPAAPTMGHSDENGAFRINDVVSGSYRAMAVVPMTWSSAQHGAAGAGAAAGVVENGFVTSYSVGPAQAIELPMMVDVLVDGADVGGVRIVVKSPAK